MWSGPEVEDGVENKLFTSLTHIFEQFPLNSLNCHILLTIRAFDLILTLRARPECQLSADIHSHKAATKYLPYISTNLDLSLNQPLFVMRSRGGPISTTLT